MRRNGNSNMFHARQDFEEVVTAHNRLVDYCELLERRILRLEREAREREAMGGDGR